MMAFKNVEPSANREWVQKGRWEEYFVDQLDLGHLLLDERQRWRELGWCRLGK